MITPIPGVMLKRTRDGKAVLRLHYSADPSLTPERIAEMRSKYSSDAMWRKEMEIQYDALGGALVYPEFKYETHVVPDSRIPRKGCRYMSLDPHPRTPHACLWLVIDEWSDWYIYRELWPSVVYGEPRRLTDHDEENSYPIKFYAEAIAALEGNHLEWRNAETDREYAMYREDPRGERVIYRLMDQAGKGFRASGEGEQLETYSTRYKRYGLHFRDPRKAHESGEDAVRDLLKPRKHDVYGMWPRLHIAESCVELILELQSFKYRVSKTVSDERDLKQQTGDYRCHLIDNLRYLANSPAAYISKLAS
jgi:hypothetical protein